MGEIKPSNPDVSVNWEVLGLHRALDKFIDDLRNSGAHKNREFYKPVLDSLAQAKMAIPELNPQDKNVMLWLATNYQVELKKQQDIPESITQGLDDLANFIRTASK